MNHMVDGTNTVVHDVLETLGEGAPVAPLDLSRPESLLALDRALERLETRDPRLVQLLHYRVFAGLELAEIAPLLQVTVRQLQRDWQRARIWLVDEMLDTDEG